MKTEESFIKKDPLRSNVIMLNPSKGVKQSKSDKRPGLLDLAVDSLFATIEENIRDRPDIPQDRVGSLTGYIACELHKLTAEKGITLSSLFVIGEHKLEPTGELIDLIQNIEVWVD